MKVGIFKCRSVRTPSRGTSKSAGLDFYIPIDLTDKDIFEHNPHLKRKGWRQLVFTDDKYILLPPHERMRIPSGIHMKLPKNTMLQMNEKSGLGVKDGLQIIAKIIDEDYEGEISLSVRNSSDHPIYLEFGMKLVQGILIPVLYDTCIVFKTKTELFGNSSSERGEGGFGSTGKWLKEN